MMVMAKGVNVGISTIYYWIHRGNFNHLLLDSSWKIGVKQAGSALS